MAANSSKMSSNFSLQNSSSSTGNSTASWPFSPLNPIIQQIIFLLSYFEIFVYLPTILLVIFSIYLILKTSILHQNLKWVLGALNLQVFLFTTSRLYNLWISASLFTIAFNFSLIIFGNLVGHVLIIERILATILVKKYENYRGPCFTLSWIFITVSLSFLNAYYQWYLTSFNKTATISFYTHIFAMLASLIEIFIISLITYMNVKHFKIDDFAPKVHPLTIRYQLTENIRTGKQLAPTFICHFITVTLSFLIIMNSQFKCFSNVNTMALFIGIAYVIHSINNFALISTLIICHPILNRKARKHLNGLRILFCAKSNLPSTFPQRMASSPPAVQPPIPTVIDVCPLPVDAKGNALSKQMKRKSQELKPADAYFRQLHRTWGDYLH